MADRTSIVADTEVFTSMATSARAAFDVIKPVVLREFQKTSEVRAIDHDTAAALAAAVLADFQDLEPRRIGTAVFGGWPESVFVAQPGHLDWLRYEDREARILAAAVRFYHERRARPM